MRSGLMPWLGAGPFMLPSMLCIRATIIQSHLAIPERAEPDTALNRTKSMAALDSHTIHPVEPEKGKFRIRMISGGIPPWIS